MAGEIGVVAVRTDLLTVKGKPLERLDLLVGQGEHLDLIMKDGRIYKDRLEVGDGSVRGR